MADAIYIIDGHAQIYRAYHALTGLSSPSGEPTNATYGFVAMLQKLNESRRPSHVVVAMDLAGGSAARLALDTQYKATRKPMPDDMLPQIMRIREILGLLGVPVYESAGFEADDVIATLVRQIRAEPQHAHTEVYICTKDKDLEQLINETTWMYDIQTLEQLDAAGLVNKKGYPPEHVRDVLALTGDTSDNIPGIPGVGPKTAAKWISQYGSLDGVLAHRDEITGKIGEALRAHAGVLDKSRELVRLIDDVPITLDWQRAQWRQEQWPKLVDVFRTLGFNRFLAQLNPGSPPATASKPAPKAKPVAELPMGGLFAAIPPETPAADADSPVSDAPAPVVVGLPPTDGEYLLVNDTAALTAMLAELRTALVAQGAYLSLDTETDSLGAMTSRMCGLSLSAGQKRGFYVPVMGPGANLSLEEVQGAVGPLLAEPTIRKVGQNLKYDCNVLRRHGLPVAGIWFDTMIASYLIAAQRASHSLDALVAEYFGMAMIPLTDLIGKGSQQRSFASVDLPTAARYAAEDAEMTWRLVGVLQPQIAAQEMQPLLDMEMGLMLALADMEFAGVRMDLDYLRELQKTFGQKIDDLRGEIRKLAGTEFNLDSPKQLGQVLFEKLGLPVIKKTKTGVSTDIDVLEALAPQHPLPAKMVEYRQYTKLKSGFIDGLLTLTDPATQRLHTSYNQTVTATGRLSSSDPNLQNIPIRSEAGRLIRRAFIAPPGGKLLAADYSQIELRVLAHYSADAALLKAFAEDQDIHRVVAAEIYGIPTQEVTDAQRGVAKTVNFGIIYGQTGFGLARVLGIPQNEAERFIKAYRDRFPGIAEFNLTCLNQASMQGFVTTLLGRRRMIPDINSNQIARRQFAQRTALNSVIQGSAADLIKLAMVKLHQTLLQTPQLQARMLMQIHDELVVECPTAQADAVAAVMRQTMTEAMTLRVPLKVELECADNWLE